MLGQTTIQNWTAVLSNPLFWLHYFRIDPEYFLENEYALKPAAVSREAIERFRDKYADKITQSDWEGFAFDLYQKDKMDDDQAEFSEINLEFEGGYRIGICFWVQGEYYSLYHPSRTSPLELGFDDPQFHLPIFRFSEMKSLASSVIGNRGPQNGLLLSKTASFGEVGQSEASGYIAERLESLSLFDHEEVRVISAIRMHHRETRYRWWQDAQMGWVNDYPHSHRNPKNNWSQEDFAFLNQFLQAQGIN